MVAPRIARGLVLVAVLLLQTDAALVTFKNQCEYPINVYDNDRHCLLSAASRASPFYGCDRAIPASTMYRHGDDPEATLAEFAIKDGRAWYDISIIPPGPGNCRSLDECNKFTGRTGFNVPVMILPTKYLDEAPYRCNRIMCHYNGCPDAFHYPDDTSKVYNCHEDEHFQVIYCP